VTAFLNQYSFLILGALLLALTVYGLSRRGFRKPDWLLLLLMAGLIFAAWWVLHPSASQVRDASAVKAEIGVGTPVLLEFQSPYCLGCAAMKPAVDRLEEETQGKLIIIRLNIQDAVGRQLAAEYGSQYTPTFVFIDAQGIEQWRTVGSLEGERVLGSLEE